ncbi:MAG: NAD(P)-binding domain-containing protein [Syntrophales bacterium]|jgi:glycerol-3-phosphate dehydrogenase (NAD(P)+)|nr:NAD(P)-binding domain-containing protein [Syntrophales bacterium]MCK9527397.1 NAD(P)-binding domain-containing protein [Syntrophales bacterium]MDX9921499.1 NAD(P)-binding domain-containing protein [Syntrophales bacterium]
MKDLDPSRIGIIGPGRLGTAFAYKFGRDGKKIQIYHHDIELCRAINRDHLNPRHFTESLADILGGLDAVPRLSDDVTATNDLEEFVQTNDYILLSVTMNRLPELMNYLRPLIARKEGGTCLISPIKGLASDEKTRELITPSQLIHSRLADLKQKYVLVSVGGPFFDVDIALGNPTCLSVAGGKHAAITVMRLLKVNRRELNAYYNYDSVGIEACGALKNVVANLKGATDQLDMGRSIGGTIFARAGVEIRSLTKLLGGSFQAFHSQAGVGDLYITVSSLASKNYRYGKYFYEFYTGNPIETSLAALKKIDGTPEGPNTIRNVHRYLEKKNMYSPIFRSAYAIFNEGDSKEAIREQIIEACQFDRRTREYIGPFSRALYRVIPNLWYRRESGFLSRIIL